MNAKTEIRNLRIDRRPIADVRSRNSNPRTHTKLQIRMIADSLQEFGWVNPIVIDEDGFIIVGQGRLEAARLLGHRTVPVVEIADMSAAQKRAYVIADNKLAMLAGWDEEILRSEFELLLEADIDFDLEVTGFSTTEIDKLLSFEIVDDEREVEEDIPAPLGQAVSAPGDVWILGKHRIACGDARNSEVWDQLLGGEQAAMVFTDPPYNVAIGGNVSGLGRNKHREFEMASGEMTSEQFTGFLKETLSPLAARTKDGALHYVCMDWRHMGELLAAGEEVYSELKNLCVWAKTNAGMGSLYRSQHELVFVFKSGDAPHRNNVKLGATGRHRSNLWTYPGANVFSAVRETDLAAHPTVKPTAMIADAILDCTKPGDLVIDAFAGSGATLLAAERTGRRAAAIEIDPAYVDLTVLRLSQLTGETPILSDGRCFDDVERERNQPSIAREGVES